MKVLAILLTSLCVLFGCSNSPNPAICNPGAGGLGVVSSDYRASGQLVVIDPNTRQTRLELPIEPNVLARNDGTNKKVYLVNRSLGSLQTVDWKQCRFTESLHLGKNYPQDIALFEDYAYVSQMNSIHLLKISLKKNKIVHSISLADFADDDGLPEMYRMVIQGNLLWVELQRLDRNRLPNNPSFLAAIDLKTDTALKKPIELEGRNPFTDLKLDTQGRIYLGLAGSFDKKADLGGIERVDTQNHRTQGLLIREISLLGNVLDVVVIHPKQAFALTHSSLDNLSRLVEFDPEAGLPLRLVWSQPKFSVAENLLYDPLTETVYVGDRTLPGIRMFKINERKELPPLRLSLPPAQLLWVR